jgi:hypothetical protein
MHETGDCDATYFGLSCSATVGAVVDKAPEVISALVPFGIAGLAITAIVVLAMYPKDGRTVLLVTAIAVICGIFGFDRYLQSGKFESANVAEKKLGEIAQEIRSMDSSLIAKMNYEDAPSGTPAVQKWSVEQVRDVTRVLCSNVKKIYALTGATEPAKTCSKVREPS